MFVQVLPPLVLNCHCVEVALVAAADKLTIVPEMTDWLVGLPITTGTTATVNVAGEVVAVPAVLVKTARYWLPDKAMVAVKL